MVLRKRYSQLNPNQYRAAQHLKVTLSHNAILVTEERGGGEEEKKEENDRKKDKMGEKENYSRRRDMDQRQFSCFRLSVKSMSYLKYIIHNLGYNYNFREVIVLMVLLLN